MGFPVAESRWSQNLPTIAELEALIGDAGSAGVRLLYLVVPDELDVPIDGLGHDVTIHETKVTFAKEVTGIAEPTCAESVIVSLPLDPDNAVSSSLLDLAFISGELSRFNQDRRIPRWAFESLYRIWIERSLRGEIADAVLVARCSEAEAGVVTVGRESSRSASIGLVAVDPAHQGRGWGVRLVEAAEREAALRGFERLTVATQGSNQAACGLYRRCGFAVSSVDHYYHLWPGIDS